MASNKRLYRLGAGLAVMALVMLTSACLPSGGERTEAMPLPLSGPDVESRLAGNSLYRSGWKGLANWEYASHHSNDGTMSAQAWWMGGKDRATGRWEVTSDGLYCRRWNNHWARGERGCFRVFSASGDGTLIFDFVSGAAGDSKQYSYQVLVGNPYSL